MTLGVAVLGTGRIVETGYVAAMAAVEDARLVAVLSRDQARADEFAAKNGIDRAYSDLDRLLADPKVDAVIVASPDATHEDQAIAAARAGKHIFCEKPMSTTLEAGTRMAQAVRSAGVTFAMGYDNRFNQGLGRIKELIEAGEIGQVRHTHAYVTTFVSDPNSWRASGPLSRYWAMSATGTHILDIYRWFFGDPARVGASFAAPVHGGAKDEIAIMVLDYPGRLLAEFTVTAVLPAASRLEIHGEKGSITGDKIFGRSHRQALLKVNGKDVVVEQTNPFIGQLQDFVAAVAERRPPRATLEDGLANVRIMQAAWDAKLMVDL